MRLAVWNIEPCALLAEAAQSNGAAVVQTSVGEAIRMLDEGEVDAALVPPSTVMKKPEEYVALPQGVLASGPTFPFVTLRLTRPLDSVKRTEVLSDDRAIGELAEIVLREQYRLDSKPVIQDSISINGSAPDAFLVVGGRVADEERETASDTDSDFKTHSVPGNMWLDIGQEWYEMTGLPMVWGLFAVKGSRPTSNLEDLLDRITKQIGDVRAEWADRFPDVFFRFNPDVKAGLDEMAHYLFYFGMVDDIPSVRFTSPPESLRSSA